MVTFGIRVYLEWVAVQEVQSNYDTDALLLSVYPHYSNFVT